MPVDALPWQRIDDDLDAEGFALTGPLIPSEACAELAARYDENRLFRNRVVMARHGFGQGEYRYFDYPLPEPIATLRTTLYPRLAPIAARWEQALGRLGDYPLDHQAYLERCHRAGQAKPTPLILRYGEGDYNRLHQDLYGDLVFPLQVTILLSTPGRDFTGGELVLTEQRPRMQSRAEVVPLDRGEGVIFAVNQRPATGTRGTYRVAMRHGVSRIRSGQRFALGIIFHDAA